MKKQIIGIFLTALLLLFVSCEKQPKRLDDFFVEFATVVKSGDKINFELDNGKRLIPETLKNYSGKEGQRVVLNYTPTETGMIKVNSVSDIFTGTLQTTNNLSDIYLDPVEIQSVWVGGNYLNMILDIEYFNKRHTAGLFRDTNAPGNIIYLSYTRNGDSPGYAKKLYLSFLISSLKISGQETPFTLRINTANGQRTINLTIK